MGNAQENLIILPISKPFIQSAARHLHRTYGNQLHQLLLLLPNQRTARMLRRELSDCSTPDSCLLPEMLVTQHYQKATLLKWLGHHAPARDAILAVPEAMPRAMQLSLLVAQIRAAGDVLLNQATMSRALDLAESLMKIQQDCLLHQVDTALLHRHLFQSGMNDYQDIYRKLFSIIQDGWPSLCYTLGAISEAEYQHKLQQILHDHIDYLPDFTHVAILGSTGSVASTRKIMQKIAQHPRGSLFIPGAGYKCVMPEAGFHIKQSLKAIQRNPEAQTTSILPANYAKFPNAEKEAKAIALLAAKTLRTLNETCLVVCPDMSLIKRVYRYLAANGPVPQTLPLATMAQLPDTKLLRACIQYIGQPKEALNERILIELSSVKDADSSADWSRFCTWLDKEHLRNPYMRTYITPSILSENHLFFAERWPMFLEALAKLSSGLHTPSAWMDYISKAFEREPWLNSPKLDDAMQEVISTYDTLGRIAVHEFLQLLDYISQKNISESVASTSRIHLLTPVEARLLPCDHVIFAGFHSGNWPGSFSQDPWLNEKSRQNIGLPTNEDATAHACHDVWMHAHSAKRITITLAEKEGDQHTQPSNLLEMFSLNDISEALLAHLDARTKPDTYTPLQPVQVTPAVSARPRKLTVSSLDAALSNPYHIYAKEILNLTALDDYGTSASARELGICAHKIMHSLLNEDSNPAACQSLYEKILLPYRLSIIEKEFWLSRFGAIGAYAQKMRDSFKRGDIIFSTELPLSANISLGKNAVIELKGQIDLLSIHPDGGLEITDFKSGAVIKKASMEKGLSAQHLGYSLLLEDRNQPVTSWSCIKLPTTKKDEEVQSIALSSDNLASRKAALKESLYRLCFTESNLPAHPYYEEEGNERYTDYDGISRIEEWG